MKARRFGSSVARTGFVAGVTALVMAASLPGLSALAASAQAAPVVASELEVVGVPPVATAPAPGAHQLEFVLMSNSGAGKFMSEAELDDYVQKASDFWVPQSRGAITGFDYSYDDVKVVTTDVFCSGSTASIMTQAAQALGYADYSAFIQPGSSRHLIVFSPLSESSRPCNNDYYATSRLGGSPGFAEGGYIEKWIGGPSTHDTDVEVFIHEIGRNFSLGHAAAGDCPIGVVDGPFTDHWREACIVQPYGDKWNIMGALTQFRSPDDYASGLNGRQKEKLGLIDVSSGLQVIDSDGTYDVELQAKSAVGGTGIEAIKIVETSPYREYSVEYDPTAGGVTIRRVANTGDTTLNVQVNVETIILSPGQTTSEGPQVFAAGQLFIADSSLLTVLPVQISGGTAKVRIVRGAQVLPTVALSANSWLADAAGQTTSVTVTTDQTAWSASSSDEWLTVSPASGPSGAALTLTATANTAEAGRQATVTVAAGGITETIVVAQPGVSTTQCWSILTACTWDLETTLSITGTLSDRESKHFYQFTAPRDGTYAFNSRDIDFNAVGDLFNSAHTLIGHDYNIGGGFSGFRIEYALTAGETYYLAIGAYDSKYNSGAYQITATVALGLSETTWVAAQNGGSLPVTVSTGKSDWSASSDAEWLTVSPDSGPNGATLTLTATANTGAAGREARVEVGAAGSYTAIIMVAQPGVSTEPCWSILEACVWDLATTPTIAGTLSDGAPQHFYQFTVPQAEAYIFRSISTDFNPVGTLYDSAGESISDHDWNGDRDGSFLITSYLTAGKTYYLTIDAKNGGYNTGEYKISATIPTGVPTIGLTDTTWQPGTAGGSLPVKVTTDQTLWSAVSDQSWLTVDPATGQLYESMTVSATANPNTSSRTGTVTVTAGTATATLTVTQAGAVPVLSVSESLVGVGALGGTAVATVSTNVVSGWRLGSVLPAWLTASTQTGPFGESVVSFTVAANTARTARVFEIGFEADAASPASFKIAQSGSGAASLTLSRTTFSAANSGATATAIVTTNQATWTATSSQTWLTISPETGVTGDVITVQAAPNLTGSARSATVTVRAGTLWRTLTVCQAAGKLTISPSSAFVAAAAGAARTVTVSTSMPDGWSVTTSQPTWAIVSKTSSGFSLLVSPNPTTLTRTATVTVTAGLLTKQFSVTQPGTAWVTPHISTWATGFGAGQGIITILTNQPSWTATVLTGSKWLTLTPPSGLSGQLLTMAVAANTGTQRIGTIKIKAGAATQTITVTQAGTGYINLTKTQLLLTPQGSSTDIAVTSRSTWTALSSDTSWLTVSPATGATGATLAITAKPNSTGLPRYALVAVTSNRQTATILITQTE